MCIRDRSDAIQRGMDLLYEANKSNLRSIAIYNGSGSLIAAEPVARQKEDPDVTRQDWYIPVSYTHLDVYKRQLL